MILILSILIGLYAGSLLILILSWLNIPTPGIQKNSDLFYSILIPVRNEEQNLKNLFLSLSEVDFPSDQFEVIFIDDYSDDDSKEIIVTELNKQNFKGKLIGLTGSKGKKAALTAGIAQARGEIIITTDADCRVPVNWLRSYDIFYDQLESQMVFGPVSFHNEHTFFEKIQTMEFSTLVGVGAASLNLGIPNMCNGANLSFKKEAFYRVSGYLGNEQLASGDDEFLMHKIYKAFKGKVFFNKSRQALVKSLPQENINQFFNQRKRWAGKWKYYTNWHTIIIAIFIFIANVSVITSVGLLVADFKHYEGLLATLIIKIIFEGIFIYKVLLFSGKKFRIFHFLFLQLTYPLYAIFFGIAANFGQYTWKKRKY